MAFQVNTNVNALNAHAQSSFTQASMKTSLERLSSGLKINKAADDASGMAIADSLRNQANSLGQAIRNANDGMGIIQIADKAMDEQIKILDTIKVKATQAAQDGQTTKTRQAIQADINRLIEGLDNIASTTSYNGQALLSGSFTNKEFQVGAYSNETVKFNIGATSSDKIGQVRFETTGIVKVSSGANAMQQVALKFLDVDGFTDITLEAVKISHSAGTGIGVLAQVINKNSDKLGVKASFQVQGTASAAVAEGSLRGLKINNVVIGDISGISANDSDGRLVAAINSAKDRTGVEAFIDERGRLNMKSADGRSIKVETSSAAAAVFGGGSFAMASAGAAQNIIVGRMTLTRLDARDIKVSGAAAGSSQTSYYSRLGFATNSATAATGTEKMAAITVGLRQVTGSWDMDTACAAGMNANDAVADTRFTETHSTAATSNENAGGAGVTTLRGAMITMNIADSAMKMLDAIRSDLGSVSNQLTSTINNITITQVNVRAAESNIREVDFAAESAEFSKLNILAQSGSYAMSQSNAVQQNILRLLQ